MDVNTRKGLKATIVPSNTTDSKILSWESEDPTIALVSATGNVTAKGPGTTTITVRAENGVSASCEVTVNSPITSVRLSQTRMTLEAGTSQQLRAMIEPVDTTDDTTLTWMSTVPSVATVDQEGNVTALREGYAIIRVETVNGISTTCRVEVVETQEVPITGVSLDQESMTLTEGESGTLNATIIPGDTTDDRTLTWSSDAPEVAVVNEGEITAIAPGTATITVTTSNGKSDSCIVTVERREIEIISVSLDHSELTMKAGRETTLNATINPADTTMSKELSWSTSNAEVATVEDGVVRAVAEGDAVISVATVNGKRAECVVHVFEVSLDALNDTIARAEQLDDEESYTASSYAAFTQALEEARATAADEEALQADVDAAQQKLESSHRRTDRESRQRDDGTIGRAGSGRQRAGRKLQRGRVCRDEGSDRDGGNAVGEGCGRSERSGSDGGGQRPGRSWKRTEGAGCAESVGRSHHGRAGDPERRCEHL